MPEPGLGARGLQQRGYPCPRWLTVLTEVARLTPMEHWGNQQTQNSDMVPIKLPHFLWTYCVQETPVYL